MPVSELPAALAEIAAERRRQIEVEGWNVDHDERHSDGSLALAAAAYAYAATISDEETNFHKQSLHGRWHGIKSIICDMWPWEPHWFKPKDKRRNLVIAGALIVAEIERLDRAERRLGANGAKKNRPTP